jgi:hypothetical protein
MANNTLKAIATKYNVAEDQISAILIALNIKTDNPSEIQLKGFERVCELMKGGIPLEKAAQDVADEAKAKATAKDNPVPAPKMTVAEREAQLNEIASRYSMGDRVQEFMKALALKSDSLTTEQFEQFRQVCEQVQKGMELAMVAQGVLNKPSAKPAATKPFPGSVQNAATTAKGQGDEQAGLVVAPKVELTAPVSQFTESIPGDVREAISRFPREDAQAVVLKSPSIIADAIEDAHDATEQGLTKFVKEEWFDEYRQGVTNPDFAKQVREMLAQGKSHKKSEGSST